jgi:chromosome segregation ATPase
MSSIASNHRGTLLNGLIDEFLQDLENELDDREGEIRDLEDAQSEHERRLDEVDDQLRELGERDYDNLEPRMDDVEGAVEGLTEQLTSTEQELLARLDKLDGEVRILGNTLGSHGDRVDELAAKVEAWQTSIQAAIDGIRKELQAMR